MQIWSVMTSYCLQLKCGKYWINDISGNIEAVFLKLGTINVHHKRNKMTPLVLFPCSCKEKCFTFSWRSGPEISVTLLLNKPGVYKAWSNRLSFASFSDFRFNPSLASMLSANFRILSLFLRISEICCLLMSNSKC